MNSLFISMTLTLLASVAPESGTPDNQSQITCQEAVVLGMIEGVTEYLPISSTGHLIVANHIISGDTTSSSRDGTNSFEIIIQLGAILAVIALYGRRIGDMGNGVLGRNSEGLRLLGLLIIATIPAAVTGVLFSDQIKDLLFNPIPVAIVLGSGGFVMITTQLYYNKRNHSEKGTGLRISDLTWQQAFFIGLLQTAALCPGTSRSMITIVAGLIVGMQLVAAAEFSFILALPVLGGATIFEIARNHNELLECATPTAIITGIVVSGIVAALSIKFLIKWLTSHGLIPFGIYRIILAGVIILYFSSN